jgi:ribose 5-phosphate isomerase
VNEGGFRETVTVETGIFITPSVQNIVESVKKASKEPERFKEKCLQRAGLFDISVFEKKIKDAVYSNIKQK